jgi:hypothetical protein
MPFDVVLLQNKMSSPQGCSSTCSVRRPLNHAYDQVVFAAIEYSYAGYTSINIHILFKHTHALASGPRADRPM